MSLCRPIYCIMLYAKRNQEGKIVGLSGDGDQAADEVVDVSNPEVQEFLESARNALSVSDADTIRVIEDLIDILVRKKIILTTDLPEAAQQKLDSRQRIRHDLGILENMMVGEKDIL